GKMENPEYFTGNHSENKELDNLNPPLTALVTKPHESTGVKRARGQNRPEGTIISIKTNNETSRIKNFGEQAQKIPMPEKRKFGKRIFNTTGLGPILKKPVF